MVPLQDDGSNLGEGGKARQCSQGEEFSEAKTLRKSSVPGSESGDAEADSWEEGSFGGNWGRVMGGLAFLKAHAGLEKTSEKPCILAGLSTPFCLWVSSKSTNSINMGLQLPTPGRWPTPSQNVTGLTQTSFSLADSKGTIIKHQTCAEPTTHNFIKSSQGIVSIRQWESQSSKSIS